MSGNELTAVAGYYFEDWYFDAALDGGSPEALDEHNGHLGGLPGLVRDDEPLALRLRVVLGLLRQAVEIRGDHQLHAHRLELIHHRPHRTPPPRGTTFWLKRPKFFGACGGPNKAYLEYISLEHRQ